MRVVFMGTPDFAVSALQAMLQNNYEVAAVVTQPDKPGGRGKKLRPSPVKMAALASGLAVYQPEKVREPGFIDVLKGLNPDIIVVAAFGQILPAEILNLPPHGCINVHASLLPAYRGAAPIHRAIINGERQTGVTIMQMDPGLDTGAMLLQGELPIGSEDTVGLVHDRLAELGGRLLVETLELMKNGRVQSVPQQDHLSCYAAMLTREDELVDWKWDAVAIKNQVRGLNPWPGARTSLLNKLLKIWRVSVVEDYPAGSAEPGQVLVACGNRGILVQTGNGVLRIDELQLQGKKRMQAAEFIRGNQLAAGSKLGEAQPLAGGGGV